jgi:fermentation-respiration switch protein FrsA (DUF1100 family)
LTKEVPRREGDMGRLTAFVIGITLLPAFGCATGRPLEDTIVFQPRAYPNGDWTPETGIEDAWFEADGNKLHGWFSEAKQPRAVVLYTHGNAGNISSLRPLLQLYRDKLNASILVFDYRGYGRSEGIPSEEGILVDARAARKWLADRAHVREQDIVLVGHSLGGGVAVDLAAKDGARGLVLESTFTSLPDAAAGQFPLLPYRSLMHNRLDSLSKISNYHGPLLQMHGDADRVIPYDVGRKLFNAANEPKQFVSVPGGGHNGPPSRAYLAALDQFLGSLP